MHALKGCCVISVKLEGCLLKFESHSDKRTVRGIICFRLLHENCSISVNGISGSRISFVTAGMSSGLCIRIARAVADGSIHGQRLPPLRGVDSGCRGVVLSLGAKVSSSCSNVGPVGLVS